MLADLHFLNELSTVSFDNLIINLDSVYGKNVSKLASRVRFRSIVQHSGQSVDELLAKLRNLFIDCRLRDQFDNRPKYQFVVGLRTYQIKKIILEDENKELADIVKETCKIKLDNRKSSSSKPAQTSSFSTHQLHSGLYQRRLFRRVSQLGSLQFTRIQHQHTSNNYSMTQPCYRCGTSRQNSYKCNYLTQRLQCNNCGQKGHKALVCY